MGKSKGNTSVEDGEQYTVERILDKRVNTKGQVEYLIKWEGYSLTESTWENENNVPCPELIEELERQRKPVGASQLSVSIENVDDEDEKPPAKLLEICGITMGHGSEKMFVLKMSDSTSTIMSVKDVHARYPNEALQFYERNIYLM